MKSVVLCFLLGVIGILNTDAFGFHHPRSQTRKCVKTLTMMPTLLIQTATNFNDQTRDVLLKDASKAIALGLGKPEKYVMVSLKKVDAMMFAGTTEPSAYCHLASIGKIGPVRFITTCITRR
jgi:hypothetical protein